MAKITLNLKNGTKVEFVRPDFQLNYTENEDVPQASNSRRLNEARSDLTGLFTPYIASRTEGAGENQVDVPLFTAGNVSDSYTGTATDGVFYVIPGEAVLYAQIEDS